MFGFACKDSRILEGIREKDVFFVYKMIKKYKKHIFRSINSNDKDIIFSNVILDTVNYISSTEEDEIKIEKLINEYANEYMNKENKDSLIHLYNDNELLKYISKIWEEENYKNIDFCEVFNCVEESEISQAGNEPCYCVVTVDNEKNIHVKEYSNDFSVFYHDEFSGHNSTFDYVDRVEIKKNIGDQIVKAKVWFKDNFDFSICAQTFEDSNNMEKLEDVAKEHSVAIVS